MITKFGYSLVNFLFLWINSMKKVLISVMMLALVLLWTAAVSAFVRYEDKHPKKQSDVTLTGYTDYAPFGQVEFPGEAIIGKFKTFMQRFICRYANDNSTS